MGIPRLSKYNDHAQVEANKAWEAKCRPLLDKVYRDWGYEPVRCETTKYDLKLVNHREPALMVEEKYLKHTYDELAIEIMQDLVKHELGWFYNIEADWLSYIMFKNGELNHVYIIDWYSFKAWYLDEWLSSRTNQAAYRGYYLMEPGGYGLTLNLIIKIKDARRWVLNEFEGLKQYIMLSDYIPLESPE
jgi:hypothetical protein